VEGRFTMSQSQRMTQNTLLWILIVLVALLIVVIVGGGAWVFSSGRLTLSAPVTPIPLTAPTGLIVKSRYPGLQVSWNKVPVATGYILEVNNQQLQPQLTADTTTVNFGMDGTYNGNVIYVFRVGAIGADMKTILWSDPVKVWNPEGAGPNDQPDDYPTDTPAP